MSRAIKLKNDLFLRALDEIREKRVKEGTDRITRHRTEIAEAIARGLLKENLHSFRMVKKDLINARFTEDEN